jgi:hypothetical protein
MVRIVCLLCTILILIGASRRSSVPLDWVGRPMICRCADRTGTPSPAKDLMTKFESIPTMSSGTLDLRAIVLTSQPSVPSVSCYSGGAITGGKGAQPSRAAKFDTDLCAFLEERAFLLQGPGYWQRGYDTTRLYMELCYEDPHTLAYFTGADGDNDSRSNDLNRYVEYREWLKSVLYLRQDSTWYCRDVESILGTFKFFQGHGIYLNGTVAIEKYILEHQKCDSAKWAEILVGSLGGRYKIWHDTVTDSILTPMDTVIPSLEDIGLEILRGPKQSVPPSTLKLGEDNLYDVRVSENPFTRATEIKFDFADYGLVKFELFDPLGKLQTGNGIGQVLDPGEHSFEIDGSKLAPGVYYARLSYHNGDVKSIMIRKE